MGRLSRRRRHLVDRPASPAPQPERADRTEGTAYLGDLLRAASRFQVAVERVRRPVARRSAEHRHELSRAIADLRFTLAECEKALWDNPPTGDAEPGAGVIPYGRPLDQEISRLQLPQSLDTIARVAGLRAALLIGTELVGRRISIPKPGGIRPDNELAKLIGRDALLRLARHYIQGISFDVPPAVSNRRGRRRRWQVVAQMTAEGKSLSDIANALECDRSTVRRARTQRPPPPLPLFGE